jgi:hypothetical protein
MALALLRKIFGSEKKVAVVVPVFSAKVEYLNRVG